MTILFGRGSTLVSIGDTKTFKVGHHMNSAISAADDLSIFQRYQYQKSGSRSAVASCYYRHRIRIPQWNKNVTPKQAAESIQNQTVELFRLANGGDREAIDKLFERLAPPLQRWASGRLPGWARSMVSTVDLVQEALMSTFKVIEKGSSSDDIAIHAYVRTSLKNRMIDELRKVQRRPALQEMDQTYDSETPSPLEEVVGGQALKRYEKALAALDESSRDAVIARIELGLSFADIARITDKNSADAARMQVSRALVKLARAMGDE